MSDAFDLQRDLELIQSIADRGVMQIEAAQRAAEAAIKRLEATTAARAPRDPHGTPTTVPTSELDEDDHYQFRRFRS